jgi:hypothetical protein
MSGLALKQIQAVSPNLVENAIFYQCDNAGLPESWSVPAMSS